MSFVDESVRQIALGVIPKQIAIYEQLIENAEPVFQLSGKNLEEACKEHAQNLMFYDVMLQECKTIEDSVRLRIETVEGELYKKYNEGTSMALKTTDIKQYIKGDPQYTAAYQVLLEIVHTKRRLEAIVEAIKSLGWTLSHVVKLRIAQLEDTTL
jgi:hypothetical protein